MVALLARWVVCTKVGICCVCICSLSVCVCGKVMLVINVRARLWVFMLCEEIEKDRENIRSAALISQQGQSSIIESNGESSNCEEKESFSCFSSLFFCGNWLRKHQKGFWAWLTVEGLIKFNIYINDFFVISLYFDSGNKWISSGTDAPKGT